MSPDRSVPQPMRPGSADHPSGGPLGWRQRARAFAAARVLATSRRPWRRAIDRTGGRRHSPRPGYPRVPRLRARASPAGRSRGSTFRGVTRRTTWRLFAAALALVTLLSATLFMRVASCSRLAWRVACAPLAVLRRDGLVQHPHANERSAIIIEGASIKPRLHRRTRLRYGSKTLSFCT